MLKIISLSTLILSTKHFNIYLLFNGCLYFIYCVHLSMFSYFVQKICFLLPIFPKEESCPCVWWLILNIWSLMLLDWPFYWPLCFSCREKNNEIRADVNQAVSSANSFFSFFNLKVHSESYLDTLKNSSNVAVIIEVFSTFVYAWGSYLLFCGLYVSFIAFLRGALKQKGTSTL